MNTLEETPLGETPTQSTPHDTPHETSQGALNDINSDGSDCAQNVEPKISGFDGGTRSLLKEPSIYLSIAIIFIAASVCLSASPTMFWLLVLPVSAVAMALHILAERYLFAANKEVEEFSAPFEGVFVLTFGAILPGIGLLAYAIYSLVATPKLNVLEEFGKLALLLVVPFFNFAVWSAVRKGYLVRPRLIGLMNGFTLGLSISWVAILLRLVFFVQGTPACKFGWMLLLCLSPFLFFSGFCLSLDLWQKTTANIRRITTTFSALGILLSLLFVLVPFAREFYVQSLIATARLSTVESDGAVDTLRSMATVEDLKPSRYPVNGFALGALLIPNRGLENGTDTDRDLFFKITGKSFFAADGKENESLTMAQEAPNPLIGYKIPGLSLAKSQLSGNIDATTLSSSVDWTLTFFNSTPMKQEARAEIEIPKDTAVSRVTLWINGEAREGAFAQTAKAAEAYQDVSRRMMDPLLVTMTAPNRILIQCSPVVPNGGDMKIRLGFKVPLETSDGKTCSLKLPRLLDSNFAQVRRHRISLVSKDMPVKHSSGMVMRKNGENYTLSGIVKAEDSSFDGSTVIVHRGAPLTEVATEDWYSHNRQFVVEKIQEATISAPRRLLVVLDGSVTLRRDALQIKDALASLPPSLKTTVYFVDGKDGDKVSVPDYSATDVFATKPAPTETAALSLEQAQALITPEAFIGGQDNWPTLKEAIERAAEEPGSAVLWIHGPQPLTQNSAQASILDLVHRVCLYDLQIEAGPNTLLPTIQLEDVSGLIALETVRHESTVKDLKLLAEDWKRGAKRLVVQRRVTEEKPTVPIILDRLVSAQVTGLWAVQEVGRLQALGRLSDAQLLAAKYRLVSPLTAAVVLESERDFADHHLSPGAYKDSQTPQTSLARGGYVHDLLSSTRFLFAPVTMPAPSSSSATFNTGGLVGAPVDPRYGQSNEVGQLADYGYDNARDIVRLLTAITLVISIVISVVYRRRSRPKAGGTAWNALCVIIVAPTLVYLLGSFMINNFGGLGGGL